MLRDSAEHPSFRRVRRWFPTAWLSILFHPPLPRRHIRSQGRDRLAFAPQAGL